MPRLSIVLLTLNEQRNIASCLAALGRQTEQDFEVVLVDAASTDGTLAAVERARPLPFALRVEASPRRLPIGEARNLGVTMARAPLVAFLSADAEPGPEWVARAVVRLDGAEMAFSRQVHDPHAWTVGAAVRGLRYHFPDKEPDDALPLASNVAAAYRRGVLEALPFDPDTNAAEDLLLARRAHASGARAVYDPSMVVRHHDVATARQEMRKAVREGYGCAAYAPELGVQWMVLGWGAGLCAAATWLALGGGIAAAVGLGGVLYAPAVRRAVRRRKAMPGRAIWLGLAASPLFDMAYLLNYVRGLVQRRPAAPVARNLEVQA